MVTRRARIEFSLDGPIWQRNYFDRTIRNDREFSRVFVYIGRNPEEWEIDGYNADSPAVMANPQRAPQGGRDGRRTGDVAVILTLLDPYRRWTSKSKSFFSSWTRPSAS